MPHRYLKIFIISLAVFLIEIQHLPINPAYAAEPQFEIESFSLSADSVEVNENTQIIAEGNVRLESGGLSIRAGRLKYSRNNGSFILSEKVQLHLMQIEIVAEELSYNSIDGQLKAKEASLRIKEPEATCSEDNCCRDRAIFRAGTLKRDATGVWKIENGSFTSCDCGEGKTPSWKIEAHSIKAQDGENAIAEKPKFYIRDTPVFMLPAAMFPLSSRRSGFLAPRFSFTDYNGFRTGEDYFLAFDRSADATFGLDFMHKRGFMGSVETRYNFGHTEGKLNAFYLPDWSADVSDNDFNRFSLEGEHIWKHNSALIQKIKLELLSDTKVPQHFGRNWRERSLDYTESSQMWEFSLEEVSIGFSSSYQQALSSGSRTDGWLWDLNGNSPAFVLNRLSLNIPTATFAGGHVLLTMRNSSEIVQTLGQADATADDDSPPALPDTSAMFDIEPEMAFPFQVLNAIEIRPYMSYRQKFFVSSDFSGEKSYAAIGADIQSRIWRIFELKNGALKHEIIPGAAWRFLPFQYDGTEKTELTRALRLLDYPDATNSPQHAEARLSNRLALRRGNSSDGIIYRFFELNLIQRVFIEAAINDPEKRRIDDGRVELILRAPKAEWKNRMSLRWNDSRVQSARSSLGLGPFHGISFGAEYLLIENGPLLGDWIYQHTFENDERFHQIGGNISWTFAKSFTLGYAVDVSIKESQLIEQHWLAAYRSKCNCWGMELTAFHRPGLNFPDVFLNIDLNFM